MLKKEYQTMYNNSQMSKAELMKLNRELEQTQITLKKLSELDPSKDIFCSFGTMYMTQPHDTAESQLKEKVKELNQKIESKQLQYFEKRYKEMAANYPDL
ncbi:hypothetical protein JH06_5167 [Blastocystis sp. subtype 4]|uniref:hypothetical protein n=1 Tax=Blastocystis sp. subtype 4 TaxID=944170 RepID=UPI00071197C3|nr:hypothetical protein JH06_5167 [Blastocystis sp. subtype 4]KNB42183.1 hypothetical protein JH06_5167 [Blastocystis sp. subtype 4]|eukprot:XP_014525626.1 hypothetical protein JH06_5167 [Blastocystis sp. subtype 4]